MHYRVNDGSLDDPALEAILPQMITRAEQSNGLNYRVAVELQQHRGAELDAIARRCPT